MQMIKKILRNFMNRPPRFDRRHLIGKFCWNFSGVTYIVDCIWFFALAGFAGIWSATGEAASEVSPKTTPWIRAEMPFFQLRVDPKGRYLAFVDREGKRLSMLDLESKNIFEVTRHFVGASFFWSPDGFRLFYREQLLTKQKHTGSRIQVYDAALHRSVVLDQLPNRTGILTFDPRDLRMQLLNGKSIRTKRIYFPDERLARWQVQQRKDNGKFLVTQNGVLWVTQGGYAMSRLEDDGSPLDSFTISPDGSTIAWATKNAKVWWSEEGKPPQLIGEGRDPHWHPTRPLLLYAGARMVGHTIVNLDLRVADPKGDARFLTQTQFSNERWPQWHPDGNQIIYTMDQSTDLYLLNFEL